MFKPFKIQCSGCAAKLKVTSQKMLGKKVACPKCSAPVRIASPSKSVPEDPDIIDPDDFEDDYAFEDDFAVKEGSAAEDYFEPPQKKKKQKTVSIAEESLPQEPPASANWKLPAVVGGGLLIAVLGGEPVANRTRPWEPR